MGPKYKILIAFCALFLYFRPAETANILFFHLMVTSSHRIAIFPLAQELAEKGHNVTYIWPMANTKQLGTHPQIEELLPSKMVPLLSQYVGDFDINIRLEGKEGNWIEQIFEESLKICQAFYESPEIQEWMNRPNIHYDIILIDGSLGECGYGLVHRFKAKLINFSALIPPWLYDSLGITPETASVPDILESPKPNEMTFYNRLRNTLSNMWWRYKFLEYVQKLEPIVKEGLNETFMGSLAEIEANTSLVMVNNYLIEEYPRSLPPMFVSFSGLWCSKRKLKSPGVLPTEIFKFLEKTDGFFYVSFGSSVKASAMPLAFRNHFFNTFRKFPKLRFLWRWTGPVPKDTPKNALLLPWFPQNYILAHPKIKGFLTQAGRPSSQEAVCHGVPLITVPIFADQDYNANRLEYIGGAINLDPSHITEERLTYSFKELLENPMYKSKMTEFSEIYRDRPIDPLDNVVYWTEYVLRHDTSIMKPLAVNQSWWERRLLDVYAFFFVTSLIIFAFIILVIYYSLGYLYNQVLFQVKEKLN